MPLKRGPQACYECCPALHQKSQNYSPNASGRHSIYQRSLYKPFWACKSVREYNYIAYKAIDHSDPVPLRKKRGRRFTMSPCLHNFNGKEVVACKQKNAIKCEWQCISVAGQRGHRGAWEGHVSGSGDISTYWTCKHGKEKIMTAAVTSEIQFQWNFTNDKDIKLYKYTHACSLRYGVC